MAVLPVPVRGVRIAFVTTAAPVIAIIGRTDVTPTLPAEAVVLGADIALPAPIVLLSLVAGPAFSSPKPRVVHIVALFIHRNGSGGDAGGDSEESDDGLKLHFDSLGLLLQEYGKLDC